METWMILTDVTIFAKLKGDIHVIKQAQVYVVLYAVTHFKIQMSYVMMGIW